MRKWFDKNRSILLRASGTLLAFVLIVLLVRQEGIENIGQALKQVSIKTLFFALFLVLMSRLFVTARWYILLRSSGMKIPFQKTVAVTFMGLFSSNFLPTTVGGDVVRLIVIIQLGVDRAVGLASLAVDRLVGMLGMMLLLPFGIFPVWNAVGKEILISTFFSSSFYNLRQFAKRTLKSFSIWIKKPYALLLSLAFSGMHVLCIGVTLFILIRDLGYDIDPLLVAGLWSVAYFVTLFPISINGYGLQELSLTFLFLHIGNLSAATGLTVAILIRLLYMTASLPGAIYIPVIFSALDKESSEAINLHQ